MVKIMPLVRQLQAEAVDESVPVAKLLRLAKVIAAKLDQKDALVWIDRELGGYMDLKFEDVPAYRVVNGTPKGFNPFYGWRPIEFEEPKEASAFSKAPLGQSLGAIEKDLEKGVKGELMFPYPPHIKKILMNAVQPRRDVGLFLSEGQLWGVIEAVRNLVLNWSLTLEEAGVLGEEMTFTEEEKKEAGPVTQQFIIQNVGVLGNVREGAKVCNEQVASAVLNLRDVADFAKQALSSLPQLPKEMRGKLGPLLEELAGEAGKKEPEMGKLTRLLGSVRTIVEGTVGNLSASGIAYMIGRLLGA